MLFYRTSKENKWYGSSHNRDHSRLSLPQFIIWLPDFWWTTPKPSWGTFHLEIGEVLIPFSSWHLTRKMTFHCSFQYINCSNISYIFRYHPVKLWNCVKVSHLSVCSMTGLSQVLEVTRQLFFISLKIHFVLLHNYRRQRGIVWPTVQFLAQVPYMYFTFMSY